MQQRAAPPLAWGAPGWAVLIPYVVKFPFAVKVSPTTSERDSIGPIEKDRALLGHGLSRQYHLVKADDTLNVGSPTSIEVEHEEPNGG